MVGEAKAKGAAAAEKALKAGNADQDKALAEATARIDTSRRTALGEIESATVDAVEAIVAKLSGTKPDRATVVAKVKAELAHG